MVGMGLRTSNILAVHLEIRNGWDIMCGPVRAAPVVRDVSSSLEII